jgi:hypothetical protein
MVCAPVRKLSPDALTGDDTQIRLSFLCLRGSETLQSRNRELWSAGTIAVVGLVAVNSDALLCLR